MLFKDIDIFWQAAQAILLGRDPAEEHDTRAEEHDTQLEEHDTQAE